LKQRNNLIMMIKNYSLSSLVRYLPGRVVLDGLSLSFFVLRRDSSRALAVLKAYLSLLKRGRLILRSRYSVQVKRVVDDAAVLGVMYSRSIAVQYYLMGRKIYSQLSKQ
jgi:hypothetical protein